MTGVGDNNNYMYNQEHGDYSLSKESENNWKVSTINDPCYLIDPNVLCNILTQYF